MLLIGLSMDNNMVPIWRDIIVTFVLWVSTRMVTGKERFSIKCVGKPTNSHLWRLNRNPPSYLFGTIHYPWDVLWNNPDHIHKNVKYAFKKSRSIYTELDFSNVTTVNALQKCRFLPGNLTLKHVVPRNLLNRLRKHFAYVRRSFESWLPKDLNSVYPRAITANILFRLLTQNWKRKRPVWIVVLIMLELTQTSVRRQQKDILDLFLTKQAKTRGNRIGGLETAEDQCGPFNNINNRQALFLLNYTLHLQELVREGKLRPKHESQQDKVLKVYLCGNLKNGIIGGSNKLLVNSDANNHVSVSDVKKIDEIEEYLMDELVYKRNFKMAARIDNLLKMNKTVPFFFAVGTGHLTGNLSIVELLQKKGHAIEHVQPHDVLSGQKRWERRRERRKAVRKKKEMLKNLREEKQREAERERYKNLLETMNNPLTTPTRFKVRKKYYLHTIEPQKKPVTRKDNEQQLGPDYVYYYTNSAKKKSGELQMLFACSCFMYALQRIIT